MTDTAQQPIVDVGMMQAWGYPNDADTQRLIEEAAAAQQRGEFNCIRDAKLWVRARRPRPAR